MGYKVVIPQDITEAGKKFLLEKGYKVIIGNGSVEPKYLKELVADADAILARTGQYTAEVLASAPKLKVIGRHGVGYDNIDLKYCQENDISITFTPTALSNAVAERTIGFIVGLSQQLVFMNKQVRQGNWEARNTHKGTEVKGKKLGLIGLGRIGSLVAKKAHYGLEMEVLVYDEYLEEAAFPDYVTRVQSLEEIFSNSDFISLHVPHTPETTKMINAETLTKMKTSAYIINCSRGELIDENELAEALKTGIIAGAATDVFNEEPPNSDHPFLELENILLTPHNAALTEETMDVIGLHAAQGIHDVLSGQSPKWLVIFS